MAPPQSRHCEGVFYDPRRSGGGQNRRAGDRPKSYEGEVMLGLTRWCIEHRRRVAVLWVAVAIVATVLAQAAGRHYATNFTLPGTESQRVLDLLQREFPAQSGDQDTVVWHTSQGTVLSASVRRTIAPLLSKVATM